MGFFQRTKGSVSIFLIMILVPTIAVCTIFIDVSRVKLAQGLAYSSADLALNTVLTQYDTELSDYYGLMASCQDIDSFYTVAEGYFEECMVSQGIAPTMAQQFAQDIIDIVKGKATLNDFMAIDTTYTTATITSSANADLTNPAIIKEQITEFMKYRGPLELCDASTGIYDKLTKVKEVVKVMPTEMKVQNNKVEYYNAENKLLEKALEVYEDLKKYEAYKPDASHELDKDYLEVTIKTAMGAVDHTKGLIADYKKLHAKYVSNWANTNGYDQFYSVASRVNESARSSSGSNYSASSLRSAIDSCRNARNAFEQARTEMNNCLNSISFARADQSKVNHIQYWVQMEKAMGNKYDNYVNKLNNFLKAKNNMSYKYNNRENWTKTEYDYVWNPVLLIWQAIPRTESYDAKDESYSGGQTIKSAYDSEMGSADSLALSYKSDAICDISKTMQEYSKDGLDTSKANNTNRIVAESQIKAVLTELQTQYDVLKQAREKLKKVRDALPDLESKVKKYEQSFDTWSGSVESNQDKMDVSQVIEQDYYEIQEIKKTGITPPSDSEVEIKDPSCLVSVELEVDHIKSFEEKLKDVDEVLEAYQDTIKSIKYRGKSIFGTNGTNGIYSISAFDSAAKRSCCGTSGVNINSIPVMQTELNTYIESTWHIHEEFASLPAITESPTGNCPKLHSNAWGEDGNIHTVDAWMHTSFPNDSKTLEKTKGILKTLKLMMNSLETAAKDSMGSYTNTYLETTEISTVSGLPSAGTSKNVAVGDEMKNDPNDENALQDQLTAVSDKSGTLFEGLDFEKMLTDGRDALYTTQYIMGMFSYETKALEGIYTMEGGGKDKNNIYKMTAAGGGNIKPGNAGTYYDTLLNNPAKASDDEWWNTKNTFTENKTLTNKMIDKAHNYSYGNEVEYILYGGTNEENKDKIYATMFFTRYALDVAPVMRMYWNEEKLDSIAQSISGMTQGVIPVPLVKLVVCLGVCAAESAVDMNYLKAGLPVAFVKTDYKNQLFVKLNLSETAFETAIKSKNMNYAKDMLSTTERKISSSTVSFSYSDYVAMYLYVATMASEDAIYKRLADVIQLNMTENYPEKSGYQLSNCRTNFQIEVDVKVKPMMIELPHAKNNGVEVPDSTTWNTFQYKMTRGY